MKEFIKNAVRKIFLRCFAITDDIKNPPAGWSSGVGMQAALITENQGTNNLRNVIAVMDLPWNDSVSSVQYSPWKIYWYYTRNDPNDDTTMDGAPIGSICTHIEHSAGVPSNATMYLKVNATTWTAFGSLAAV